MTTQQILENAVAARKALAFLKTPQKDRALLAMAARLEQATDEILAANQQDLDQYGSTMTVVMQDRLRLTPQRIADMAKGIRAVKELHDPVGAILAK